LEYHRSVSVSGCNNYEAEYSVLAVHVDSIVAAGANCNEILASVFATSASECNMVYVKSTSTAATTAFPVITLQNYAAERHVFGIGES
jgi:hypothetical protein